MIYHADDTILITKSFDFIDIAIRIGELAFYRLRNAIQATGLRAKSRRYRETVRLRNTMQYLRLLLDSRLRFEEHLERQTAKMVAAAGTMWNLAGPSYWRRRLYATAVKRFVVYAKQVWSKATTRIPKRGPEGHQGIEDGCQQDDSGIQDHRSKTPPTTLSFAARLLNIQLPTFNGDYLKWETFRNLYSSTVHNVPGSSDAAHLQHLKSILVEEAVKVISNIPVTEPTTRELGNRWSDAFRKSVFLRLISLMCSSYRQWQRESADIVSP
ncbi:UNVERIFIED_CONTAM: hypothetical protein PYX00_008834 [Menopon gallinae]|uniref:Reverse transcriptase n=1 Tax=Menopon gallinae TaxID=328185 RepID=A0AAW2H943_9NEOP